MSKCKKCNTELPDDSGLILKHLLAVHPEFQEKINEIFEKHEQQNGILRKYDRV